MEAFAATGLRHMRYQAARLVIARSPCGELQPPRRELQCAAEVRCRRPVRAARMEYG
jgi:hypothetical protein